MRADAGGAVTTSATQIEAKDGEGAVEKFWVGVEAGFGRFGVEIKVVTESEVAESRAFRIIWQVSEQDLRVLERSEQLPRWKPWAGVGAGKDAEAAFEVSAGEKA